MDKYDCGLYKITNLQNLKIYIGSSKHIKKRWNDHKRRLRYNKHPNKHLQAAYNQYGEENFQFDKILICEEADLLFYEQRFIDYYKSYENEIGYNLRKSVTWHPQSEETKQKLSEINKGKPTSANQKIATSKANKGKKKSKESIEQRTLTRKKKKEESPDYAVAIWSDERREKAHNKVLSDEHREILRQTHLGKPKNPSSIEKQRTTRLQKEEYARLNNLEYGMSSKSAIEKNRISHTGLKQSQETINKRINTINSNPETRKTIEEKKKITRAINKAKAIEEGRIYGASEWTPEHREKMMKARADKKRIRDESIMFEAQMTLQNTNFNI